MLMHVYVIRIVMVFVAIGAIRCAIGSIPFLLHQLAGPWSTTVCYCPNLIHKEGP